jgi:exodeoxyribonuclease-5
LCDLTQEKLTVADLSPDQREVYSGVRRWLSSGTATKSVLTLGGYAGTGKSTVVSVLAHELPSPLAFAAYTGKASSGLGRKLQIAGITTVNRVRRGESRPYCGTIHGLIYMPCPECMVEEQYEHTYVGKCREGKELNGEAEVEEEDGLDGKVCLGCDPPPPVKRAGPCSTCNEARFLKRGRLDRPYRLIVVDEASMVDAAMLDDLKRYSVPILAVGDHGQLPPVRGKSTLMLAPDLRLEKIHRQAEGNPIIALSARFRATCEIDRTLVDGERIQIVSRNDLREWIGARFDASRLKIDPRIIPEGIMGTVLVTWTNRQRTSLNDDVRKALGTSGGPLRKGEVLICLRNKPPIYNGMRGVLLADAEASGGGRTLKWEGEVDFVEDGQIADVRMADAQFFAERPIDKDAAQELGVPLWSLGDLFDLGYALTCHKMQGSQCFEVGVDMSKMPEDDLRQWGYTAITRATERLVLFA